MTDKKMRGAYQEAYKNLIKHFVGDDAAESYKKCENELPKLIKLVLDEIGKQDDKLRDAYREAHDKIVEYMISGTLESNSGDDGAGNNKLKNYRDKWKECLTPILSEIVDQLKTKHGETVKIKTAVIQCNSLHPKINARLRIPWRPEGYDTRKIPDDGNDKNAILYLHPDKPTHILTEILLRLKPQPTSESDKQKTVSGSQKDWVGILRDNVDQNGQPNPILEEAKAKNEYLYEAPWDEMESFSNEIRSQLETWRKDNEEAERAVVALGEEYPKKEDFRCVTERVYYWFLNNHDAKNAFYLADLVDSEQLAGLAAELKFEDNIGIPEINAFLKDCQWMLNRYVFSLIQQVEKAYSGEGPSYPDAYFSYSENGDYEMIKNLIVLFTPYDSSSDGEGKINERYKDCEFNNMGVIEDLFRKIRVHFEITKGEMGKYAIGYKKHAYEVACVVAGIMDVLFFDRPDSTNTTSVETIVRQCSPGLEEIDGRLKDAGVPFLFRQLFKGLSKEDQLFLIPQYREHFIHSFYVFVFGAVLMSYAPINVVPPSLRLSRFGEGERDEVKEQLKKWFLVSMWHDIAYMIEKGNMVLEQHILSLMREGRREKGLLPWLPSLGNLMQVDKLLEEIRKLSKGAIEICSKITENITDKDLAERLPGDVVIAAAFERRDHGV